MTTKKRAKKAPTTKASARAAVRVQALRKSGSPGLTQAQLAAKADVGLNTVRGIEGDIGPMGAGVNNLEKVANALGVHVSELLR